MGTQWVYSSNLMGVHFDVLGEIAPSGRTGTTFKDKNALITGFSSIGEETLKGHLSGVARVVVSTSLQPCHSRILPVNFPAFLQQRFHSETYCRSL